MFSFGPAGLLCLKWPNDGRMSVDDILFDRLWAGSSPIILSTNSFSFSIFSSYNILILCLTYTSSLLSEVFQSFNTLTLVVNRSNYFWCMSSSFCYSVFWVVISCIYVLISSSSAKLAAGSDAYFTGVSFSIEPWEDTDGILFMKLTFDFLSKEEPCDLFSSKLFDGIGVIVFAGFWAFYISISIFSSCWFNIFSS